MQLQNENQVIDMLNDVFMMNKQYDVGFDVFMMNKQHDVGFDVYEGCSEFAYDGPSDEYDELLKYCDEELYAGCQKYSKLSFL